jgi:hypothetical protein
MTRRRMGGVDVEIRVSLTSELFGDEWSASGPGRFTRDTHWIGGGIKSQHGGYRVVKILDPTGTRTLLKASLNNVNN